MLNNLSAPPSHILFFFFTYEVYLLHVQFVLWEYLDGHCLICIYHSNLLLFFVCSLISLTFSYKCMLHIMFYKSLTEPRIKFENSGKTLRFCTYADRNAWRGGYNRNASPDAGINREFHIVRDNRVNPESNQQMKSPVLESSIFTNERVTNVIEKGIFFYFVATDAMFIPAVESLDTSYFLSHYVWNPEDENVQGVSDFDALTVTCSSSSFSDTQDKEIAEILTFIYEKLKLKQILQPPVIASIHAMAIGAVPFLKKLIFTPDAPLFFFTDNYIILGTRKFRTW